MHYRVVQPVPHTLTHIFKQKNDNRPSSDGAGLWLCIKCPQYTLPEDSDLGPRNG